ncbi:MAG: hypothetical protein ABI288_04795 [Ginsengibacter sp.]
MSRHLLLIIFVILISDQSHSQQKNNFLSCISSPVLFRGNEKTAYRDPAVLYHNNKFYLFFTLVRIEDSGKVFSYTAMSMSEDLKRWSPVKILTPRNQKLNYCSPGNVVQYKNEWILCLQTYPRPDYTVDQMPRFGTGDARIFILRSTDLQNWSTPELIKVKGPDVSENEMGRMIDPYLLEDKDEPGKWWCFYKQNGVSMSFTYDFRKWTYFGHTESGENACVLIENNKYVLFHSLKNGIAIKRSADLEHWQDWGPLITLGQNEWSWAKGRISAGAVINLKSNPLFGKYIMFFHGSGPLTEEQGDFDKNASIGIAWSDDLRYWSWPGKAVKRAKTDF